MVDRHEDEIVNLVPMLNRVLLPMLNRILDVGNLSYKAFSDKEIECVILKEPLDKAQRWMSIM